MIYQRLRSPPSNPILPASSRAILLFRGLGAHVNSGDGAFLELETWGTLEFARSGYCDPYAHAAEIGVSLPQ